MVTFVNSSHIWPCDVLGPHLSIIPDFLKLEVLAQHSCSRPHGVMYIKLLFGLHSCLGYGISSQVLLLLWGLCCSRIQNYVTHFLPSCQLRDISTPKGHSSTVPIQPFHYRKLITSTPAGDSLCIQNPLVLSVSDLWTVLEEPSN